jgi:hypothetical protein
VEVMGWVFGVLEDVDDVCASFAVILSCCEVIKSEHAETSVVWV